MINKIQKGELEEAKIMMMNFSPGVDFYLLFGSGYIPNETNEKEILENRLNNKFKTAFKRLDAMKNAKKDITELKNKLDTKIKQAKEEFPRVGHS